MKFLIFGENRSCLFMTPENTENDCLFMTLSRKIRSKKYDDNFDGSVHCMLCGLIYFWQNFHYFILHFVFILLVRSQEVNCLWLVSHVYNIKHRINFTGPVPRYKIVYGTTSNDCWEPLHFLYYTVIFLLQLLLSGIC